MYKQWDPCQSAYRRVVVFSDRQPQRRSQVPFFAKASIHYQDNQKQILLHFSLSNTFTDFCESFAKVRESIRESRVALPRGRFMCSQVCRTTYSALPQLDEDPQQQLNSRIVYLLWYILYLYIHPMYPDLV